MARKTTLASQLLAVTAAVFLATAGPAAAGTGPTLGGPTGSTFERVDTATINTTATCHPDRTSTVNFTASGTATGPFPGPFTARGSYPIGRQTLAGGSESNNLNVGPLNSFKESFTISSALGTISGTKDLAPVPPDFVSSGGPINTGACTPFSNTTLSQVTAATGTLAEAQAYSDYDATIKTPSGTFRDAGNSFTIVDQQRVISSSIGPFTAGEFFEYFFNGSSHPGHGPH